MRALVLWCSNCHEVNHQSTYSMSRLYDALKETNRVRQGSDRGGDKASLFEAWGIKDIDIPPVQVAPEALAPRSAEADSDIVVVSTEDALSPTEDAPRNGLLGALAAVVLDRKARLIPHAIDAAVVEHYRRLRTKILQIREEK